MCVCDREKQITEKLRKQDRKIQRVTKTGLGLARTGETGPVLNLCECFQSDFCFILHIWEQIFYLIQFTGQLLIFFNKQDSLPLVLLLVLGLKLFPLALAGGNTHTRIVKLVTLYKLTFIP